MPISQRKKILVPEGPLIWTYLWIFRIASSISPFVDPLFFYILEIDHRNKCLHFNRTLAIVASVLRSVIDFLNFPSMINRFKRRMERLMTQNSLLYKVAYVYKFLILFLAEAYAIFPQLQLLVLSSVNVTPTTLVTTALIQYCCRLYWWYVTVITSRIEKDEKDANLPYAWFPTAANSFYYCTLASHVVGACWYLLSIKSELRCWRHELNIDRLHFDMRNVTCGNLNQTEVSRLSSSCSFVAPNKTFNYGIYDSAITSQVIMSSTDFFTKFLYCFSWALRNLSSFGQSLEPSTARGEIAFATSICICSLVLITLLFRNIQNLDRSYRKNFEEKRIRKSNTEAWMSRQNVPESLRERIRQHEDYKWKNTPVVQEQTLIHDLPKDIRRDIKRHLYLTLLTKVPQFETMDSYLLDALCDKLKHVFYMKKTCILLEGEAIEEMIFIKRGNLQIRAKNGPKTNLGGGYFCEELVTWALDPNSSSHVLPVSTKTVETITDVEAYALMADDLKFIAPQLRTRLRDEELRTFAARKIQKAWLRCKERNIERSLLAAEARPQSVGTPCSSLGIVNYTSRFAANALRPLRNKGESSSRLPQ